MTRHSNLTIFHSLCRTDPALGTYRDPTVLLSALHSTERTSEEKNTVLAALLAVATTEGRAADLATELLLLALWPGLSVIRRRLRNFWTGPVEDLDADLVGRLSLGVRSAKHGRITRVAATLLRNIERDLRREMMRTARQAAVTTELDAHAPFLPDEPNEPPEAILSRATEAVGRDGFLVAAVHVGGWSQKDVGQALGLSHAAARKRCQRALGRLQKSHGRDVPIGRRIRLSPIECAGRCMSRGEDR